MTWNVILDDVNIVLYGWLGWNSARGGLRCRRDRQALEAMERDRWARLAPGPSLDADLGTRIARAYLVRENILDRAQCDKAAAYIVADVSGRWPADRQDLRRIASAIGEPASLGYLRSVVPGQDAEPSSPVTDDTAMAVVIRLLFTFCPPGRNRGDYLAEALLSDTERRVARCALPVLLLRRGTNDRAALESAS